MEWWVWALVAWAVLACATGIWSGFALRVAERRERVRRGGGDRRRRGPLLAPLP